MKNTFLTIALLLFSASPALAHEEEVEITNLAEADWMGPFIAILIIIGAIIFSRIIRARRKKP